MQNIDLRGQSPSFLTNIFKLASGQFCPLAVFSCQKELRNWTTGYLPSVRRGLCP